MPSPRSCPLCRPLYTCIIISALDVNLERTLRPFHRAHAAGRFAAASSSGFLTCGAFHSEFHSLPAGNSVGTLHSLGNSPFNRAFVASACSSEETAFALTALWKRFLSVCSRTSMAARIEAYLRRSSAWCASRLCRRCSCQARSIVSCASGEGMTLSSASSRSSSDGSDSNRICAERRERGVVEASDEER